MPAYIVATIIVVFSALACYAFVSQYIEKRRVQNQRIVMTLKTKHRNLVFMLGGIPENLLSNDLISMVYRSLLDTCEKLKNIEPNNPKYQEEISTINTQLSNLAKTNTAPKVRIDNPAQMIEIRQHLQEFLHFINQQAILKAISKSQAVAFQDQITKTAFQMTIDEYVYHAKEAQKNGKLRLAIHYFTLARKQLGSQNANNTYGKQISQLDAIINKLEALDTGKKDTEHKKEDAPQESKHTEPKSKEWEAFNKKPEEWQKKQVYD